MVSVIIPAFNEEKVIGACLKAFLAQKTSQPFEIILVDNNCTDNTLKIAAGFVNKLNLRIVREKRQGRGAARAAGFKAACGEYLLSTDADTVVPPDWIEKISTYLKNNSVAAVTGSNRIENCGKMTNFAYNKFMATFVSLFAGLFGNTGLNGFNFGIKRSFYHKSGGFNPNLDAQEDIDLGFKVAKIGTVYFDPKLVVVSSGRRFCNGLLSGLYQPFATFVAYYFLKRDRVRLKNVR